MNRPIVDREIILAAAKEVAARINADAETIADHYRGYMNGYDLAKELENYAFWDIDMEVVEELDGMRSIVMLKHDAVCNEWANENNIMPQLESGTVIKEGIITGVCKYSAAKYLVKENGCTQEGRSLLINFEDAVVAS